MDKIQKIKFRVKLIGYLLLVDSVFLMVASCFTRNTFLMFLSGIFFVVAFMLVVRSFRKLKKLNGLKNGHIKKD